VKQRLFWALVKYGLGIGLLAFVIWQYWSYPAPKPNPASTAAGSVGVAAAPHGTGPLAAAGAQVAGDHRQTLGLVNVIGRPIHVLPLLLAGILCLLSVLLTFVRWYVLVRAQGLPFTLPNALRLGFIGSYLNTFLPGSVGGDIFKATFIAREQTRRTVAVATVLIDRGIGLVGLVWLAALVGSIFWTTGYLNQIVVSAAAADTLKFIVAVAVGLAAVSVAFWLLLGVLPQRRADKFAWRLTKIPKVGHSLAEFWRAVWMYRCRGRSVGLALAMAMVGHVGFILTFYFAALTLSRAAEIPSLGAHALLVPVGMSFEAGFPAPGGVGGGEVGFGELYQRVGFPFDRGVLGSLVRRMLLWTIGLAGYFVYLRMRPSLQASQAVEMERALRDGLSGCSSATRNHVASTGPTHGP
jgi:uncharacterized protein (TIRG00374 family)